MFLVIQLYTQNINRFLEHESGDIGNSIVRIGKRIQRVYHIFGLPPTQEHHHQDQYIFSREFL